MIKQVSFILTILFLFVLSCEKKESANLEFQDDNIDIVFFAGGSKDGIFAPIVARGALAAEKNLGVNVKIVWSQWDIDKMTSQFKAELENHPDAICMMGHPGSERLDSLIKEAKRKNIIVTLQNVDIPELREKNLSLGFGYVGQNLYNSGKILAEGLIRKYSLKKGAMAIVFHSYSDQAETRGVRGLGSVEALENYGLIVHSIYTPYEFALDSTTPEARKYLHDKMSSIKNLRVIINDGIINNEPIIDELKYLGKKPGEIKYGTFDLSPVSIKYLKEGYIGVLHDQQPFLQGYYSVLQVYMAKKYKFSGLYIDTGVGLIDDETINDVEDLVNQGIR